MSSNDYSRILTCECGEVYVFSHPMAVMAAYGDSCYCGAPLKQLFQKEREKMSKHTRRFVELDCDECSNRYRVYLDELERITEQDSNTAWLTECPICFEERVIILQTDPAAFNGQITYIRYASVELDYSGNLTREEFIGRITEQVADYMLVSNDDPSSEEMQPSLLEEQEPLLEEQERIAISATQDPVEEGEAQKLFGEKIGTLLAPKANDLGI